MTVKKSNMGQQFAIWMTLLALYYNSYRYPLQINSTGTSSTYRDTPMALVLGKYMLAALIVAFTVALGIFPVSKMRIRRPLYVAVYSFLAVVPIVQGILAKDMTLLESGLFLFVPMLFHLFEKKSISCRALNSIINYGMIIAIVVDVIQIALFFTIGRLPALAWAGSMSVRFGSYLDDPNGFGILISLFAGLAMLCYSGWKRALVMVALFLSLVVTQSLTALVAVPIAFLLCALTASSRKPRNIVKGVALSLVAIAVIGVAVHPYFQSISDVIQTIGNDKSQSIAGHAKSFDVLASKGLIEYLGLNPVGFMGESGFLNIVANSGILYLLIYLGVYILAIFRYGLVLANTSAPRQGRILAGAAFCFLTANTLATVNLPMESVFPINLLAALFLGMSSSSALHGGEAYPRRETAPITPVTDTSQAAP